MDLNQARDFVLHCQKHPEVFFTEVLGCELEPYQDKMLRAIAENDRVAVKACHDVGKSWTFARVVLWYMSCFPGCKVITTAPTYNQVKNILWAEIRSAHSKSKIPLGGKMNLTEWQMTPEGDWFAIGFTPRNELSAEAGQGSASSFQGFHADNIMVLFDEATGVPHGTWTMAEGMLTSGQVKFVVIGNPTSRNTEFYRCFQSPEWTKISLNCFDSPNLIANGITDLSKLEQEIAHVGTLSDQDARVRLDSYKCPKPYLLSLKWVVSMGLPRKWGVHHPLFLSKVRGEFPTDSDGTLIPLGFVEEARLRVAYPTAADRRTLGVDVARYGSDSTILTDLHGKKFMGKRVFQKLDTTAVAGEVLAMAKGADKIYDVIVIDETGLGSGVVDILRERQREKLLHKDTEIRGVQFGAGVECDGGDDCEHKECARAQFVNLKAKMFKFLSNDLKGDDGLTLPQEDVYNEELPTILYRYDSKGRMLIESKDEYKKRTGRSSPDHADSLALANFGRYDELKSGNFPKAPKNGFGTPFAAALGRGKQW